jgi:hypothetical protein
MVLDAEDDGQFAALECALLDDVHNHAEAYLCGQRVAMVNQRESVVPVPTVQLNTTTAGQQNLTVHFGRGFTFQLGWKIQYLKKTIYKLIYVTVFALNGCPKNSHKKGKYEFTDRAYCICN